MFFLLTKSIKKCSFKTKCLQILVYLLAFLMLGGHTIYFVPTLPWDTNIYADYILLCFMLNILLLLVLCLVFCPPILPQLQEWIAGARLPCKVKFQRHEQTQDKMWHILPVYMASTIVLPETREKPGARLPRKVKFQRHEQTQDKIWHNNICLYGQYCCAS